MKREARRKARSEEWVAKSKGAREQGARAGYRLQARTARVHEERGGGPPQAADSPAPDELTS